MNIRLWNSKVRRSHALTCAASVVVAAFFSIGMSIEPAFSQSLFAPAPESKNQTMRITDEGIFPSVLRLRPQDSLVFLLNDSSDSLLNFELNFGKHITHCSGGILRAQPNGLVTSTKPLEPRNFAATCFHEKGNYPVVVYGLKNHPKGATANVIVE